MTIRHVARALVYFQRMLDAFVAQEPRALVLLALRIALLVAALTPARSPAPALSLSLLLSLTFIVSLAFKAALVPFVIVAAVAIARRRPSRAIATVAAASVAVSAALSLAPARRAELAPEDPAAATTYWRREENLFRARAAALVWARAESAAPGEAYLALAEIDWELGHHDTAERVLAKVLARPSDDALRARAERVRDAWHAPR